MTTEELRSALRKAYHFGQVYWQQADSEFISHHRKADETAAKFEHLIADTVAAFEGAQPAAECKSAPQQQEPPDAKDAARYRHMQSRAQHFRTEMGLGCIGICLVGIMVYLLGRG